MTDASDAVAGTARWGCFSGHVDDPQVATTSHLNYMYMEIKTHTSKTIDSRQCCF